MSSKVRNHKDNVFCMLYREKKHLLSLYNAMNGTAYEDEERLEVVTLESAICISMHNDAAFVIDSTLNLYEQQASANPNMPLRDLYYVAEEFKKVAPLSKLYGTKRMEIPTPRFVVFYNGTTKQPERQEYRLSNLFTHADREPELELKVTVLNINEGCNKDLLSKCESLQGYAVFVEKIRKKLTLGMKPEEAVSRAVEECIEEDILADFFVRYKEDVMDMSIWEFDQELHDQAMREDGEAIGFEKGIEIGIETAIRIYKKIKEGETDNRTLAELCGCKPENVEFIRRQLSI